MQLSFEIGIEDSCVLPTNLSRLLNTFTAHCASANPNSTIHSVPDSIIPTHQSGQLRLNKRGKSKRGNGISTLLPITRPAHRGSQRKSITIIYCVAKLSLQTSLSYPPLQNWGCLQSGLPLSNFDCESNTSLPFSNVFPHQYQQLSHSAGSDCWHFIKAAPNCQL